DTTQTATFADLPAGWATPAGGGLHLTTLFELDAQGRPVTETDPGGGVTYTVYKDPEHETRVYRWDPVNGVRIGPTVVTRDDHDHGYSETLTMSAAPNLTGGRPDGTEAVSDIQSLSRTVVNDAGQTVAEDQYFDLTGVPYDPAAVTLGTAGVNYLRTQYGYDAKGRQVRAVSPAGTITRTVYDGFDRPVGTWVGTDDAPTGGDWTHWSPTNTAGTDLVQVSATEYDNGGVGDGLVTRETEMPGTPYANRVTQTAYDWRDRPVATKEGADSSEDPSVNRPITYADLDNLGEAIASEMYDGDGLSITADADSDGVPDRPSASALRAKSTADYDELGRAYQSKTFSVDPANGTVSTNALVSQWWYNSRGLEMKASSPGGLVTKSEFDGLGRTTKSYVTDGGGDGTYADAGDVTGDTVLSQTEWTFDPDGNPTLVTTRDRFHDETRTGPLGDPGSADKAKARASYQAMYYDPADRLVTAVDVGTNGGTAYTRPTTPDARDDTHHRTDYAYNSAGEVETVTDPKGLKTTTDYDLLGRVTKTVENDVDMPASDADDKTTEYTYDAGGHQATLKANLTGGGYQETKWVYGITGPVVSNDILKEVQYPDPSTGDASPGQTDSYTYNRLGEVLAQADRNGTTHAYSLDVLGRQTLDAVSQLGAGVDGTVMQIGTAYDGQGNPYLVTSYDGTGGVVNQVQRAYNGLGQLIQEWQAVNGTVNTSTTPSVQYGYSFLPAGTNNNSRLTSITYPNGRRLDYEYAAGLADSISRLSDIKDGSTVLESYNYLGLGTVVTRAHPQPGVDLTYAKLAGESDGPAGDQYLGLDRFGQVVDQRWTTSGGANVDRYQYAYDRDGNRTSRTNVVNPAFNETYGYDGLNQLTGFNTTGTAKSWDYDAAGNWDGVTTNGATQTRTHDRQNEIGSATGQTAPTYDADGNQTTDFAGRAFTYDAWDRVRTAAGHTYEYDGLGRRVADTAGATTTDAYYTAAWQVAEERVNGTPRRQYVWSPVYVDALVLRDRDADNNGTLEERLWAAQDADYNVTAVFDNAGNVVERYAYDPYGAATVYDAGYNVRSGGSLYTWTYLFQGYAWDPTTGKYHARHRDYDPVEGRFASNDPLAFAAGDVNFYRFVANQPTNYRDPSGEAIVFDDEAAAKAFMGDMGNKYGAKHLKLIKGRKGQFYVTGDVRDRDAFFKYADDAFPGTLTKTLFDETDELRKLAARRQNFLMAAGVAGACAFDFVSGKDGSEATFGSTDGSLLTEDRDRRLKEKGGNAPAIVDIGGTGDEHGAINVNINGDYGGTKIPRLMPRIGKSGDLPFMDGSVSKVIMESVPLSGDVLTSTAKEIARIAQSGGEIRLKNPNNETSKRIHDAVSAALGRRLGDRTSSVDKDGNLTTVLRVK
ncbi:MAG: RHS repeat protein, partial [Zavarzinella sp.]|nr:RHS repeat protein [Zavarzinella sp.]